MEVVWDQCCAAALGVGFETVSRREVRSLSGGEQKRLVLEALLRGPDEVLLLDEPDNYLDVPGTVWLEQALLGSPKTVLLVSHDRELLARAVDRSITVELGGAGNTAWIHGGSFAGYQQARADRFARLDELRRRWDEEYAKLKALVLMYKQKAAYNDGMASRYHAAQTRLRKFEQAGPPEGPPREQNVHMRLRGGRSGKRAVSSSPLMGTSRRMRRIPQSQRDRPAGVEAVELARCGCRAHSGLAALSRSTSGVSGTRRVLATPRKTNRASSAGPSPSQFWASTMMI
jgi:ATPase subunit of ABC transporter with duplicated ATPase domains